MSKDPNYGNPEPLDNGNYQLALPGYFDVNLTTNYRYNDRLGAWLTLANLANTKYSVWGGTLCKDSKCSAACNTPSDAVHIPCENPGFSWKNQGFSCAKFPRWAGLSEYLHRTNHCDVRRE